MNAANVTGRITTHVLDTAAGRPAAGLKIDFYRLDTGDREPITSVVTNDDGRCDTPLLSGDEMRVGVYQLEFSRAALGETFGEALGGQMLRIGDRVGMREGQRGGGVGSTCQCQTGQRGGDQ